MLEHAIKRLAKEEKIEVIHTIFKEGAFDLPLYLGCSKRYMYLRFHDDIRVYFSQSTFYKYVRERKEQIWRSPRLTEHCYNHYKDILSALIHASRHPHNVDAMHISMDHIHRNAVKIAIEKLHEEIIKTERYRSYEADT